MADALSELDKSVSKAFQKRAKRFHVSSLLVKGIGIAGFAAVATVAQFTMDMPVDQTEIPWSRVAGIGASIIVFIGGLFVAFTESDASDELALAQEALSAARTVKEEHSSLGVLRRRFKNIVSSNIAQQTLAESLVERVGQLVTDEDETVKEMLETVGHELSISCGFEQTDTWSIAVQRQKVSDQGNLVIRPIAHKRAVDCALEKARDWPADVGISARCMESRKPILVDDMTDSAVQSALAMDAVQPDVYRSIYAHPILVGDEECWGVVIATSNAQGHFSREKGTAQSHHTPLVQFAVMARLALQIRRMSEKLEKQSPTAKPSTHSGVNSTKESARNGNATI